MTKSLALNSTALVVTTGSLESYVQSVHEVPVLSVAEEKKYATRLFDHGDVEKAFNWLADLPTSNDDLQLSSPGSESTRVYNPWEQNQLQLILQVTPHD